MVSKNLPKRQNERLFFERPWDYLAYSPVLCSIKIDINLTEKIMIHYFKDNVRKSIKVTVRFTPDEMKVIDGVMNALGRNDKTRFLHNAMMTNVCRLREMLIKEGAMADDSQA